VRITANFGYREEDPAWEIVGVVADVRSRGPRRAAEAEIFVPHAQFGPGFADVVIRTAGGGVGVLPAVREQMRRLDPNVAMLYVEGLAEAVDREAAATRLYLTLVAAFAVLAVFLASVGLYGVVAFLVVRRTREIGVRMALGARRSEITRLVVAQGLRPAAWGLALGLGAALLGGRAVESVLFQVEPRDPVVFTGVTALLVAVVLAASVVPARRAAAIDPTEALRSG
jgi:ABC-type antimicrobial peptide transport system permease subunit